MFKKDDLIFASACITLEVAIRGCISRKQLHVKIDTLLTFDNYS